MIVEQESATNLCNQRLDPIDTNHIDIVKPASEQDKPYRAFKSAYLTSLGSASENGLRAQVENLHQDLALTDAAPSVDSGETIYCDTVKLNLVIAHAGSDKTPVIVNSISVDEKPLDTKIETTKGVCKVDVLSSHPHGIIEKNVYVIALANSVTSARWIKDEKTALPVRADNLLQSGMESRGISLKYDEEPVSLDVYIQSSSAIPQALTFTVNYDQNGPHAVTTKRLLIWK